VARNQLGFDPAEARNERSVPRRAALTTAVVTFVGALARRLLSRLRGKISSAKLASAREEAVKDAIFASAPRREGSGRNPRRIAGLL
jgi:hypothetical protein